MTIPRLPAAAKHAARGGICLAGEGFLKNAAWQRQSRSARPSRGHYKPPKAFVHLLLAFAKAPVEVSPQKGLPENQQSVVFLQGQT